MHKSLIGVVALLTSSASEAAIVIGFNNPTGNLGTNTQLYSNSGYSVTASGYSNFNFGTNTGTANNLFGKNDGGDESGVGLLGDPSGQHEIWYGSGQTVPTIILDVSSLLGVASSAQFRMGSTTNGEQWILGGFNGSTWSSLGSGSADFAFANLPGWGSYTRYAFLSGGTVSGESRGPGNVLLSALSVTPGVPEPATWAMMLLGFGGIGFQMRRQRRQLIRRAA